MTQLEQVTKLVDATEETTVRLATDIWNYAELSYAEVRSAAALCKALEDEGFVIEMNIANIPTAFTATYKCGDGGMKVGLLAEYDALDGLSQVAGQPTQEPVEAGGAGHGCGHNLLGAGCFSAAVALKNYLVENNKNGTVVFFGCPAEEGAGSKQFIARAGCFDDIDFAYTWHPGTLNEVGSKGNVAIMGANFIFDGIASHAGGAPHLGRSALDAVELMNVGVNYLREHMIDQARIHYAYSDAGGTAPNVVQSHAVIKYEVRAPKVKQMQELFTRVIDVAKGAALMTGTTMKYEITMAFSDYVPNKTLSPCSWTSALRRSARPSGTIRTTRRLTAFCAAIPAQRSRPSRRGLPSACPTRISTPCSKSRLTPPCTPLTRVTPDTAAAPPTWATSATRPRPSCSMWLPPASAMSVTAGRTPPSPARRSA